VAEFDIDRAVRYAQSHADLVPQHRCGEYTRKAIQAGLSGAILRNTEYAKNYGTLLLEVGFKKVGFPSVVRFDYKRGDVVVIQGTNSTHPGHMAIFDGMRWISDFKQRPGFDVYPGGIYRNIRPHFQLYRWPDNTTGEGSTAKPATGPGIKAESWRRPGLHPNFR
jgi:hypothetical protein